MSTTISTFSMSSALTSSILSMQSRLSNLQKEISSGTVADLGDSLGAKVGVDLSYGMSNSLLTSILSSNKVVSTNLSLAQTALTNVASDAQSLQSNLVQAANGESNPAAIATQAQAILSALVSSLNSSAGGQFVFGGINSGVPPVSNYFSTPASAAQQQVASAFSQAFGMSQTSSNVGSITAAQMQSFLSGPFADLFSSSNWSANWSQASSQATQSQISPGLTVDTSVTANAPALQQLAEGYTMLSDLNLQGLSQPAYNAVISTATSLISQGIAGVTQLQANVGEMQSQVTSANNTMTIQQNFFQTQIGNLENVDQTQTAVSVNNLTTQLQTAYQLTAKLQQLSLAQYL